MKTRKVAIIQSNYIPWKGYFDIINKVDEFILYDDVQYPRWNWKNRSMIKTRNGIQWLTILLKLRENIIKKSKDTIISEFNWTKKYWNTIKFNYTNSIL